MILMITNVLKFDGQMDFIKYYMNTNVLDNFGIKILNFFL